MSNLKTNFGVRAKHEAFFTGGKIQVSADQLFTFCQCGTHVHVMEVSSGKITHSLAQEDDVEVTSFTLSTDNQLLFVAYRNLIIRQWNWKENKVIRTWKAMHTAPVSCMNMDKTSTLLATGGADATIKVWDVVQQYCTHNLRGHQGVVSVVEFHPDNNKLQLFTAAGDSTIRIWQLETSRCIGVLEGHYSAVTSISISLANSELYSCGRDKIIMTWDLDTFKKKKTIAVYESLEGGVLLPHNDQGYPDLNVTSTQPHVITGGSKGLLSVWNVSSGVCVFTRACVSHVDQRNDQQSIVSISLSENILTAVTYDHNILQYNMHDLHLTRQYSGYNDDILDMKYLGADESRLIVATNSERVKIFNVDTWNCEILHGHTDIVMCLDVSHDGLVFLTASKDRSIRLWQCGSDDGVLQCVAVANGHTHSVLSAAFSRLDKSFIVSGSEDLTLKTWRLPQLELGKAATLTARVTEKAHEKDINSVTVSPNDKLIATGSQDKTAKLWRASDLSLLGIFRGHKRGIWCVQFSPVDQVLATASADTSIKMWALSDFSCVKTFEGHESSVLRVAFMSRGMQLVSSGSDGLLKLWTIKNNDCVKTIDAHEEKIWALSVTKSEETLATGAGDSNIIIWKDITEEEISAARAQKEDLLLKEQELQNLIQQKKYLKAIGLAITLEQPFRLLSIFKEILGEENVEKEELQRTLSQLRDDQLDAVLRFASVWNTNSRHCHEAQCVLSVLLTTLPPQTLLSLPNARTSLASLLPYTERHFQRMNRLLESSMFIDYTWQNMRLAEQKPPAISNTSEDQRNDQISECKSGAPGNDAVIRPENVEIPESNSPPVEKDSLSDKENDVDEEDMKTDDQRKPISRFNERPIKRSKTPKGKNRKKRRAALES